MLIAIETIKKINRKVAKTIPYPVLRYLQNKLVYEPKIKSLGVTASHVPLFNSVFFEVRTRCNGTCEFCPASVKYDTRRDMEMPFELYRKVIDELQGLSYLGRIAYHVNSEPLIFKNLAKFVVYARKELPGAWIQILTNGKALTTAQGEALLEAGINELTINVYNDDIKAPLPERIREFKDLVLPKYYKPEQVREGPLRNVREADTFHFTVYRRRVTEVLGNRAGTAPNKRELSTSARGFCDFPFTQFNITADGTVSMCCSDFFFSVPMGNVNIESIMQIWYGDQFNKVRKNLLNGNRNAIETCRQCDHYGVKRMTRSLPAKLVYLLTSQLISCL